MRSANSCAKARRTVLARLPFFEPPDADAVKDAGVESVSARSLPFRCGFRRIRSRRRRFAQNGRLRPRRQIAAPVSARYVPISPGARENNQVAPTSGISPMPTSGIARRVDSVTMRWPAWAGRSSVIPPVLPWRSARRSCAEIRTKGKLSHPIRKRISGDQNDAPQF